jgi:membrane-associated phospholipid phosphatase
MVLLAVTFPGARVWTLTATYLFTSTFIPIFYVVWLVRTGRITDIDIQLREQRIGPLILTIVAGGIGSLVLAVGHAPLPIALAGLAIWLETAVILLVTLRWKVSMHSAAAAATATLFWCMLGMPLPLLLGVPIIAWSRVRLRRHTLAQTIVGAVLGIIIFLIVFSLIC